MPVYVYVSMCVYMCVYVSVCGCSIVQLEEVYVESKIYIFKASAYPIWCHSSPPLDCDSVARRHHGGSWDPLEWVHMVHSVFVS